MRPVDPDPGVINRPVGQTCPSDCFFLNNGCYAQRTEKRFEDAVAVGKQNLVVSAEEISQTLEFAHNKGKDVRIHERGDFVQEDKVDQKYLTAWRKGIKKLKKLPFIWTYTHVLKKCIAKLHGNQVSIYASVHNEKDIKKALQAGFKLFAYVLATKKKKGGSHDYPKFVDLPILGRTLVCPENRQGKPAIQCERCRWCVKGKGNVAFLTT